MKLIKEKLIPIYEYFKTYLFSNKVSLNVDNSKKNIFMFLCPDYGNIGDLAIEYAQKEFIKNNYPDYNIIEIPVAKTYDYINTVKKYIKKSDIITLIGGGSLGDMYPKADFMRLFIIKSFKNNKVISFPQTINFSNSKYGKRRLKKNLKVINSHPNIVLFAREQVSYELMKKYFSPKKVKLCPDIVLSINFDSDFKRDGVVFSFRNDNERKISDEFKSIIINSVKAKGQNIIYRDTTILTDEFNINKKYDYFNEILSIFSKSKLVITDRLHGMVFSYITATPCIVLGNNNHKIMSTYNTWLKDCNFIKFIDNFDNIDKVIDDLLSLDNINKVNFDNKYLELKNEFK